VTFLLNMIIGLALAVFQTALVPRVPVLRGCYDLILPFVIYQGIFRPFGQSVLLTCALGFMMGELSGATVGLYVITYLWVLIAVRWGVRFFHMGNYYLAPLLLVVAVLFENALFGLRVMLHSEAAFDADRLGRMLAGQVGWALISAPLCMMLLNALHHGWAAWISHLSAEKGNGVS
jgi:cell shape-determining protein MreD